ncbi:MAG TPA: hypothetical protein VF472_23645 [Burkholderiaceae bacterium]
MNSIQLRKIASKAFGHPLNLSLLAVAHSLLLTRCGLRDVFDVLAYFAYVGIAWSAVFLGRGAFNHYPWEEDSDLTRAYEKGCLFMGLSCLLNLAFVLRANAS